MKLLSAQQIRDWDKFTIHNEPISSLELMERAASVCKDFLLELIQKKKFEKVVVVCGRGNNGGDGLAISRLLLNHHLKVSTYVLSHTEKGTEDFLRNLSELKAHYPHCIHLVKSLNDLPNNEPDVLFIDAITGTGVEKPFTGIFQMIVDHINALNGYKVSIDLPSGMPSEWFEYMNANEWPMIKTDIVLTFQLPKRSLLQAESSGIYKSLKILDIGLHPDFISNMNSIYEFTEETYVSSLLKDRIKFSHKGTYGHLLSIGGSEGKAGAQILMSKAAMRTGCGLVTALVTRQNNPIIQSALPECMTEIVSGEKFINEFPKKLQSYQAISTGPGLGIQSETNKPFLEWLPKIDIPIVLDADALNIISTVLDSGNNHEFKFPSIAVITPHPKEFDRLMGKSSNSAERLQKQIRMAVRYQIVVVLKGAYSTIALPSGIVYYNSTGNEILATAGSGDVLTGVIGSLLAQGYSKEAAAIIGVYMHGMAGDMLKEQGDTIIAGDIIDVIPKVIKQLRTDA